ncbi:RNA polymerase sigma factor [Aestuariibius insulae]|uniref:RNA polymerase sigma factor n=1 Tax=Aestuariibius insulae TaxID=2058287 RepID=UPI00345E1FDF
MSVARQSTSNGAAVVHADPRDEIVEHLKPMRAFAMSLTKDWAKADDIVQDTIVKAWTNIDKFEPGTNMRAWLFTILRNTFYSSYRKVKREVSDTDGVFSARLSEKPSHDGRLQMRDFERALSKLPIEQREALILVGASGFSYEEAAMTCGVAVGTIKSRVNRARNHLSALLDLKGDTNFEMTDEATLAVVAMNTSVTR